MLSFRCWESVGDFLIHFSLVANRVNLAIIVNADGSFAVPTHRSNRTYAVRLLDDRFVYNCPDFGYCQIDTCMHIHAVKLWIAARTPQLQNELKSKFFADDVLFHALNGRYLKAYFLIMVLMIFSGMALCYGKIVIRSLIGN